MGWLWFLGTLLPVLGIVQVGRQWIADRYTYLPAIGLSIVVASAFARATSPAWRQAVMWLGMLAVGVLCMLTWTQAQR